MDTIQHPFIASQHRKQQSENLVHRFIAWCTNQENNRIGWVAVIITSHGCLITPLTLLFVMMTGNHFIFWPFVIGAMAMTVVSNLAALPTKLTIPVFFISLIIDLVIIGNCIWIALAGA